MSGKQKKSESYESIFSSWGLPWARLWRRQSSVTPGLALFLATADDRVHVGTLVRDDETENYVFSYTPEYRKRGLPPISDFPKLAGPNAFDRLPAFFEARIPPLHRADVAAMLVSKSIDRSDVFSILARVAPRTISSPYEFELRAA